MKNINKIKIACAALAVPALLSVSPSALYANPIVVNFSYGLKGMSSGGDMAKYLILAIVVTAFVEFVTARFMFKSNKIFGTVFVANALSVPLTQVAAFYFMTRFPESDIYLSAEVVPLVIEYIVFNSRRKLLAEMGIAEDRLTTKNILSNIVLANAVSFLLAGTIITMLFFFRPF